MAAATLPKPKRKRLWTYEEMAAELPETNQPIELWNGETSWHRDRIEKKALYEQFGVKEYWIVDPEGRTIEVFALSKGVYRLHSKATGKELANSRLLAGFNLSLAQLDA